MSTFYFGISVHLFLFCVRFFIYQNFYLFIFFFPLSFPICHLFLIYFISSFFCLLSFSRFFPFSTFIYSYIFRLFSLLWSFPLVRLIIHTSPTLIFSFHSYFTYFVVFSHFLLTFSPIYFFRLPSLLQSFPLVISHYKRFSNSLTFTFLSHFTYFVVFSIFY